ncbi:DUF29 domain-containing protein [Dolichospermum sp. ST_con]|nr:DUF29 domain-containing protein [Dolichospermum sp. ST_con]MDD1421992.1 DUF29 domain-containing protein [Dolichospermum sp. ST_sed1]MDD1426464.1 DUF29 domain-containing protein [Dolichospermum sp. ST_sed9]MDD1432278.1 DUF29 domain-containing protein [Dolichospermum sp. ST_sed6]MDD1435946.1 DUF29 domain-containing protein [Dolichospermum sp. ST_sed10]MDD1442550.1 DUF29 domain-containing protein [Dolichospermum sp. ST_sed3]MDD1446886.1 DUF29 domain-containing protein [Dolichospermum sp. ST_s
MKTQAKSTLYETDFNSWLEQTAIILKAGKLNQLDIENLLEEIEGMSRKEKDALESNLIRVLQHLLKWNYQPGKRSPSWSYTIIEHSRRLNKVLKNSPSLKPYFDTVFDECYNEACKAAAVETQLPLTTFPESSPFTKSDVLDVNVDDYFIE